VSTSVLPDRGTDDGPVVVATFIDITARMVAESDLAAARDRAEHADRAKTAFLSVVSHEFRTPLTSIVGYAELLNDVHAVALSEDQQEDINEILAASDRLTRLIDDLLDVGRIEAGRLNLELGVHDVGLIVSRVLHALRPQAEAKGLTLTAGPSNGIQLLVDLERMTQVLTNLVMNAIKFTSIGEVMVTTERDNDMVAITVSDTGVGIPEEKLASIFREFEQADPSPTRRHGGLGLGLPISRGITELHGGTLTVVSTPGKGSAFTVRVPVSD
ncbi:MAG: sensor histidine kinase, partial [Chloroflexota bacterium]